MTEIKNRKASFNYYIEDTVVAGIVLVGTEVKSVRAGKANIKDSYAIIKNNEAFLLNMHISKYENGSIFNHDEDRTRKLLLNKREIIKLKSMIDVSGYTLVPLRVFFKNNRVKVEIGICKGKKNYDKRESLKEKDVKRQIERSLKDLNR